VVLVPGCTSWLAIGADVLEAVAHLTPVRNDALYKSTVRARAFYQMDQRGHTHPEGRTTGHEP